MQPTVGGSDERYLYEHVLGQGGGGAVYLVKDRETGEHLALKKLHHMDAQSVLRLKREFRALADIHHPNLVKLYDLGQSRDAWFLTMEYVRGRDLLAFVAAHDHVGEAALPHARLIRVFHQLALGVRALHRANLLHRDLKPSNVLIDDDGRVVVLDFGLVRELNSRAIRLTADGTVPGTPAYMAPEQATDMPLTEAADWYAFGVMLYEALCGHLPFDGPMLQVLQQKLTLDPYPLAELAPAAPAALTGLCMALLERDPSVRPRGDAVVQTLLEMLPEDVPPTGDLATATETKLPSSTAQLFGRDLELEELWSAIERAEKGESVVVHVSGTSGAGKTALVERFLDQLEDAKHRSVARVEPLVLRSRCYEREAMPFKALDGVMDTLVRHLASWNDVDVVHLLTTEAPVLARLFPVLERLPAVQRLLMLTRPGADAMLDRQRAEHILRELFGRLAERGPVVLWIDDLQWGDLDSASILAGWIQKRYDASFALFLSYRSDEIATSACLKHVFQPAAHGGARPQEYRVELAPLATHDLATLCAARLGPYASAHREVVDRIVQEAQGSPFLALQLVALVEAKVQSGDTVLATVSLDELVEQTGTLLADEAKTILETLAVAGRPMSAKTLLQAAGVLRDGRTFLHALRGLNLVRTRNVDGEYRLECYHDRVRERVQSSLTRSQRECVHANLFRALDFTGHADADWLHTLALGANLRVQALHYGLLAAERATATLAFERAAELFQRCLELSENPAAKGGELWRRLARALVCCGRGAPAAEAYLEAAKHAPAQDVVGLKRLAASLLLRSARYEEGEAQVRQVLDAMQIELPTTDRGLLAAIAWERTRLSIRGLRYTRRAERDLPASLLARVDLYDALRIDTQGYDPLRATLFQLRGMNLALQAGEPKRILRALCSAANMTAIAGGRNADERTSALLARAETLARELGSNHEYAGVCSARALSAYNLGHAAAVAQPALEAERIYRSESDSEGSGNYFRRLVVAAARIGAWCSLGETQRFLNELRDMLHEIRATDNRAFELYLIFSETRADEIQGQLERSRPRLERQFEQLPKARFGFAHALHLESVMRTASATEDYAWARAYLHRVWPRYLDSHLRRTPKVTISLRGEHARILLNQYILRPDHIDPIPFVREDLRALSVLRPELSGPHMRRIEARLALPGDRQRAATLLRESAVAFQARGFVHDAARDRYALGLLVGGTEGEALCAASMKRLVEDGFADPMRDLRSYYPELVKLG